MYEESLTGLITHDRPCVLIGLSDALNDVTGKKQYVYINYF